MNVLHTYDCHGQMGVGRVEVQGQLRLLVKGDKLSEFLVAGKAMSLLLFASLDRPDTPKRQTETTRTSFPDDEC